MCRAFWGAAAGLSGVLGLGMLVTSAVVSSLYPAPTVLLARILDGEHLGPRRIAGLVLALAGVALMAVA